MTAASINESAEPATRAGEQPIMIGRYLLHRQIARGGMATIHIARLMGDEGFTRIVAAKRLLPEFAEDAEFVAMFLDEARIASKVHHRNVVPVLDVVTTGEEAILVQEYVHGAALNALLRLARQSNTRIPLDIAVSIACQVLAGLHAAHETLDELGEPLHIVHRDVSPQNVMIAVDGTARLLDFGVAKATMAAHVTREGQFKGKLAYSAPEQLRGQATRQSDVYSLSVLLWELVVGHRMHQTAQAEVELVATIMNGRLPTVTDALAGDRDSFGPDRWRDLQAIEPILQTGLAVDPTARWLTAADMERALTDVMRPAPLGEVAAWAKSLGRALIEKHERVLAAEEASWRRVGTTVQRRIATGEPRRGTQVSIPPSPAAAALSQPRPSAPPRRGVRIALISLCGLVVVLGVGIVLAMRGPAMKPGDGSTASTAAPATAPPATAPSNVTSPASAAVHAPTSEALRAPPSAPSAGTAKTVAPETPRRSAPDSADPQSTTETQADPKLDPKAERTGRAEVKLDTKPESKGEPRQESRSEAKQESPAPSIRNSGNRAQRAVTKQAAPAKQAAPTPPPPPAAASPAPTSTDCNPPYYYEGQKKIFKPNCL